LVEKLLQDALMDRSRRDFLRLGAVATVGMGAVAALPAPPLTTASRIGVPRRALAMLAPQLDEEREQHKGQETFPERVRATIQRRLAGRREGEIAPLNPEQRRRYPLPPS
jgi:hypothetical protein